VPLRSIIECRPYCNGCRIDSPEAPLSEADEVDSPLEEDSLDEGALSVEVDSQDLLLPAAAVGTSQTIYTPTTMALKELWARLLVLQQVWPQP
jgi:hypothetical protein